MFWKRVMVASVLYREVKKEKYFKAMGLFIIC